jgi:hypothetical protein
MFTPGVAPSARRKSEKELNKCQLSSVLLEKNPDLNLTYNKALNTKPLEPVGALLRRKDTPWSGSTTRSP